MRSTGGRRWVRSGIGGLVAIGLAMAVVGCAEDEPEDFTADNRSGFLAACTDPLADSRLTSAICECVFEESQDAFSFEEFAAIDAELLLDPEVELPDDAAAIVAGCIIEEAEL